jgi:hypothetical protein
MPYTSDDIAVGLLVVFSIFLLFNVVSSYTVRCVELSGGQMISSNYSIIDRFIPTGTLGQKIWSADGSSYALVMQSDGNLVLYKNADNTIVWQSNTAGKGTAPYKLYMQATGDLQILDSTNSVYWTTNTGSGELAAPGAKLMIDNTGFFKLVDTTGKIVYISDCTQLANGPFTGNCVMQWWKAPTTTGGTNGCSTSIDGGSNNLYKFYVNSPSTTTTAALQTTINNLKTAQDEGSAQMCYGKSVFDQYNMTGLNSGQILFSTTPPTYIPRDYTVPTGTTYDISSPSTTLGNCMQLCNNDPTCVGFTKSKADSPTTVNTCYLKKTNTPQTSNDPTWQFWVKQTR